MYTKPLICPKHNIERTYAVHCKDCKGQVTYRCTECERERWTKQNQQVENKQRQRKWHLQKNYGLTTEAYNTMVAGQNGVCAICGTKPNTKGNNGKILLVDHNHKTGEVRGLLCHRCNKLLSDAQDSPAILEAGAEYLRPHL